MEHEIIGHANKAIKVMKDKKKPLWDKFKEIGVEILIIVFAVTFAALIERTRENFKEKAEAKEFVLGLRGDLKNEVALIQLSKAHMDSLRKIYTGAMKLNNSNLDSIENLHFRGAFKIEDFNTKPANGRYDGFKSSGKIQTIDNDSLRNDILEFYEDDVPSLGFVESTFDNSENKLIDLLIDNADSTNNDPKAITKLLASAKAKMIFSFAIGYSNAVSAQYDATLTQAQKIEKEIDAVYK